MKKIISLFVRNYDGDRLVRNEVVAGAEWVIAGEGTATRKFDGTCCTVRNGKLYKRYEVQKGRQPPPNFEPANEVDPATGKQQGWLPVGDGPDDQWHREAFDRGKAVVGCTGGLYAALSWDCGLIWGAIEDGTYELCGPKVQSNPEGVFGTHALFRHGCIELKDCPRDFDGLKGYLQDNRIEGVVWHQSDGRMVKIKRKDFFRK